MSLWSKIKGFFKRLSSRTEEAPKRPSIIHRIFGGKKQTQAPQKDASEFIKKEITDKEIQNRNKYNSFRAGNPDMQLSYKEWDTMVTTLGTMGDTIDKFGYEAFIQLSQDLHDENISLSSTEMADLINQTVGQIRSSDDIFTPEDAMDLLRENIYTNLLDKATR